MHPRLATALLPLALAGCLSTADAPPPAGPLDWTVGAWTGVRRSAESGEEHPIAVRVRPVLGGTGTLRELEVRHDGGTYRGLSVELREAESGRWVHSYTNDVRGTFSQLVARDPVGDDVDVWRSEAGADGVASRARSERLGPDRWRTTVSRSTDGGRTWTPLFVDELERVSR